MNDNLPVGNDGLGQGPQQYIETLSSTSGLPHIMVRKNMEKIHFALSNMSTILNGLTRGLDLEVLTVDMENSPITSLLSSNH